jgi:hypothetical protein
MIFAIKFTNAPTGDSTLSINGTTPIQILKPNGAAIADTQGVNGQISFMVFDGSKLVLSITPNNA